jgi:hypothetical protein
MKLKFILSHLFVLVVLLACLASASARRRAKLYNKSESNSHWDAFKRNHSRTYRNRSHEAKKYAYFNMKT